MAGFALHVRASVVTAIVGSVVVAACSSSADAPPEPTTPLPGDSCGDRQRNGDEIGVDCGGRCKACDGAACASASDCSSGRCDDGVCGPSPGKTCGVGTSSPCRDGEACALDGDCASDLCTAAKCSAPGPDAHKDGRRNAGETGVDCGGTSNVPCPAGQPCKTANDCVSACNAGTCTEPSDSDGKKNGDETDIDCGGPVAKKCALDKACVGDTDCGLSYCAPTKKCEKPSSTDTVKNGTETDVDCGGAAQTFDGVTVAAAPRCALAKRCAADADCASSVCSDGKVCVEAPSCRPIHGGATCGAGEVGEAGAQHESCCKNLPVPGVTMVQNGVSKQVYLDKYEITAGRVRAWVAAIKAQYGGVPNVRAWVKARMATDPILNAMFPGDRSDYLPAVNTGQLASFPAVGGGTATVDLGLLDQLGPTSYYRGVQVAGTSGCYMGAGSYGHRTYWYDKADSDYYEEVFRAGAQDVLDAKSMNCMTPIMFAAFCAWDGGYMVSQAALAAAYGTKAWPWGDTPTPKDTVAKIANYNLNTREFSPTNPPRYLFPVVNYGVFANDFTSIIAAPGRFPGDIASQTRPGQESWMDLGGNMLEWSQSGGAFYGWTGSSFEGHFYGAVWRTNVYFLDKYGKGSTRCMRLR